MARAARLQLRSCPSCGSRWAARSEREKLEPPHVVVSLRCGACGVWRCVLTTIWGAERYERDQMRRLLRVLADALRLDLLDAADFALDRADYVCADR
jgi:hypothetical protein